MSLRLEPPFLADPALQAVLHALPNARPVGGCVRDAILGLAVADIDLATPSPPDAVVAALAAAGLRAAPTGIAHGTVTAISGGRGFEVTTLRRDIHTDGRHAVVAFTDDWHADAARRDFTFNAMSLTREGTVFDPFDGIADLRAQKLRFVGDPAQRVAEDRLRVLRYFRFFARYAALPPDAATSAALRNAAPDLHRLSIERVWSELQRILAAPDPRASLHLMQTLGVLAAVLPEAGDLAPLDRLIEAGAPPDPMLRLAALVQSHPLHLAKRLRMSSMQEELLHDYIYAPAPRETDSDDGLRRLLADRNYGRAAVHYRAWLTGASPALRQRLAAIDPPVFPLLGRDVEALGIPPGPRIGEALRQVADWWRAGGCTAGRQACLARLAHSVGEEGRPEAPPLDPAGALPQRGFGGGAPDLPSPRPKCATRRRAWTRSALNRDRVWLSSVVAICWRDCGASTLGRIAAC